MSHRGKADHKEVLAAVREYRRRGWIPTPLDGKNPSVAGIGWQMRDHTDAEFAPGLNVGVIFADGLADIDLDAPEARAAAPYLLPRTQAVFGRASGPNAHWIYHTEKVLTTQPFSDPIIGIAPTAKRMLVELRSGNRTHQTMFPPSVHPEGGERLTWVKDEGPSEVGSHELMAAVRRVAAAALIARYWPKGQRHSAALALAGALANLGWSEDAVVRFIKAVCAGAGDEESDDRVRGGKDTFGKLAQSGSATGWPTLRTLLEAAIVARVRQWLGVDQHQHEPVDFLADGPRENNGPKGAGANAMAQLPVKPCELVVVRGDAVAEEALVYAWKPNLPMGKLAHFGGNSSQAKTPVTIDLAARFSTGSAWPDGTPNQLGPKAVIILNIEDGLGDTILPRFRLAGGDKTKLWFVKGTKVNGEDQSSFTERSVALDHDFPLLAALARSIPDLGLIIIDPVTNYLGGLKMNDEGEVRSLLTPLAKLAAELGVVIITVGHFNRRERGTEPLHRMMGAAAFSGVARAVYAFGPDPEDSSKFAHVMTPVRCAVGEGEALRYKTELISENCPDGPPLDIIRVVWTGKSSATAEDSVDPPSAQEKSQERAAADLLKENLRDGPRPAKDCQEQLRSEGCDVEKLNMCRIRRLAGVGSKKFASDRFNTWYLEDTCTRTP